MPAKFIWALSTLLLSSLAMAGDRDLVFDSSCETRSSTESIVLGFGGDLLMHMPLQTQGARQGFESLWPDMVPIFRSTDLTYLNLETPISPSHAFSSYPDFNTSPRLLPALVSSGVGLVTTANNHALDKGPRGADETIDNLQQAGLDFVGTRKSTGEGSWYRVKKVKDFNIAFVACAFGTNGNHDPDGQVLHCYDDHQMPNRELLNLVQTLAQDKNNDAVIVLPHWGTEYQHLPGLEQRRLAQALIDSGAIAIVGTHPHVIQPWQKITSRLTGRSGMVVYSTGNFVSYQTDIDKETGVFVLLTLEKVAGELQIGQVKYLPLYMEHGPHLYVHAAEKSSRATSVITLAEQYYGVENILKATDIKPNILDCQ